MILRRPRRFSATYISTHPPVFPCSGRPRIAEARSRPTASSKRRKESVSVLRNMGASTPAFPARCGVECSQVSE